MPRRIKKQEAVTRTIPPAKKRERQKAINALLDSYIRDERDILVLVIKVK
jgi:hypothetical protein